MPVCHILPATCKAVCGVDVPIPTLPEAFHTPDGKLELPVSVTFACVEPELNTTVFVPVSSDKAPDKFADVKEPRTVALPADVICPVRLALVITLAAVPVVF